MNNYFVAKDGKKSEPFEESEVLRLVAAGVLSPNDLCWHEGMANWQQIASALTVPSAQTQTAHSNLPKSHELEGRGERDGRGLSADPPVFRGVFKADLNDSESQGSNLGCAVVSLLVSIIASLAVALISSWGLDRVIALIVCVLGAYFSSGMFSSWSKSRNKPHGLYGSGLRILTDGRIEIGKIEIQVNQTQTLREGLTQQVDNIDWKVTHHCPPPLEILVNIMRTEHCGWMLGNIVLNADSGQLSHQMDFIGVLNSRSSSLWTGDEGRIRWLSKQPVAIQLESVGKVLQTANSLTGGRIKLTFTEYSAAETASSVGRGFGAVGGALAGLATISSTNAKQAEVNDLLVTGTIPVESLAGIVRERNYELVRNDDPKRFRKW